MMLSISFNNIGNKMVYPYSLPSLAYSYGSLEPYIDALSMEIHHTRHHQTYIDNLNNALIAFSDLQKHDLEWLLKNIHLLPESIQQSVLNNGGGHLNHSAFWLYMTPGSKGLQNGFLMEHIKKDFGSFQSFQDVFNSSAKSRFGSGWAWLALDNENKLIVSSTANQNTLIAEGLRPILGLDVWEHAYYLKYQNRRVDYIQAWWHVVNWDYVQDQYARIS